jgi:hypothetical protein
MLENSVIVFVFVLLPPDIPYAPNPLSMCNAAENAPFVNACPSSVINYTIITPTKPNTIPTTPTLLLPLLPAPAVTITGALVVAVAFPAPLVIPPKITLPILGAAAEISLNTIAVVMASLVPATAGSGVAMYS